MLTNILLTILTLAVLAWVGRSLYLSSRPSGGKLTSTDPQKIQQLIEGLNYTVATLAAEKYQANRKLTESERDRDELSSALVRHAQEEQEERDRMVKQYNALSRRTERLTEQNKELRRLVRKLGGDVPDPIEESIHPLE